MRLLKIFLISFFVLIQVRFSAQVILNGDFGAGTLLWGCSPEVAQQSSYGGTGTNNVAEIDAAAGLCQNVTGFIPGNTYYIAVDCSRRLGGCPSPAVTDMNIIVVGSLSVTVTRTNTTFGLTQSAFLFTATSLIHTIILAPGPAFGAGTCGMIVDNLVVSSSALPVELTSFSGEMKDNSVFLFWATATEKNNKEFEIQKSKDGNEFIPVTKLPGKVSDGNSASRLNYQTTDPEPFEGVSYYRLKQLDHDGSFAFSDIITVNNETEQILYTVYPNPGNGIFNVGLSGLKKNQKVNLFIYDQLGGLEYSNSYNSSAHGTLEISPDHTFTPGCYNFCFTINGIKTFRKVLVL